MAAAYDYSSDDDDDEQQCPLCIEDMDITDKHFKPCPCGFQICQFCYNSIRSGPDQYNRCPACRRPYDDESIEYKKLSPEDLKREQERKQRKEAERKQREREKLKDQQSHDLRDKKHLANMRVIQKNLVYVIGLNPSIPSEELQTMLRRDEFFGQYGRIQKIVVNKRVNGNGNPGVGVYVTFARKEDAARCIAAVDGSMNDGKYLRAAYGTTKYCSSYLRGQNCPNPNCMFLHEPGEEADSFNRHPSNASTANAASQSPQASNTPLQGDHPTGTVGAAAAAHGATLTAANTPALPVWGKVAPQIPPVSKLAENDCQAVVHAISGEFAAGMARLASAKWALKFSSELVEPSTKFPPMFSLPMDEKRRIKVYNKAIAELDKLSGSSNAGTGNAAGNAGNAGNTGNAGNAGNTGNGTGNAGNNAGTGNPSNAANTSSGSSISSSRPESASSNRGSPVDTPTKSKKHNSQHLLAHLMRDGDSTSQLSEEDSRLDINAAHAFLNGREEEVAPLKSQFADVLRRIGGDLMQPPAPVTVDIKDDVEFAKSEYVDDGPHFDLNNIPKVELTGDVEPSVWAAIEDYTRLKEQTAVHEKAFSSAKAQTKKRVKKIRV